MALNPNLHFHTLPQFSTHSKSKSKSKSKSIHYLNLNNNNNFTTTRRIPLAISKKDDSNSTSKDNKTPKKNPKSTLNPQIKDRKPRRGKPSEAAAVEDFIRGSLKETFAAIREQNSEVVNVIKDDTIIDDDEEDKNKSKNKGMVVEEEDPNWPVDAEIGWGIRASEYFEKHPIKNVVGDDGVVIDWEGELDDNLVKEINCLEWETFAFHPSPLIVLVFERYNRATENWKALKELEKAAKVYWNAKDRLPPRTVKLDMNLETDLAYALKVRDCPQILFLRGNRIIYRETQSRTADELVQLIAHFYYKAKKPSWMKDQKLYS